MLRELARIIRKRNLEIPIQAPGCCHWRDARGYVDTIFSEVLDVVPRDSAGIYMIEGEAEKLEHS